MCTRLRDQADKPAAELSPGARYTRAWRARERAGRCLLRLEVDEAAVVLGLVDRQLLDPLHADDRTALNAAAAKALKIFCGEGEASPHDAAIRDKITIDLLLKALRKKTHGRTNERENNTRCRSKSR